MTTIINTPRGSDDNAGAGLIVGAVVVLVIVGLLVYFGLPMLQGGTVAQPQENNIEISVPAPVNQVQPDQNQPNQAQPNTAQ